MVIRALSLALLLIALPMTAVAVEPVTEPEISEETKKAARAIADRAENSARGQALNQEVVRDVARSRVLAEDMRGDAAAMEADVSRRIEAFKQDAQAVLGGAPSIEPERPPSFREILGDGDLAEAAQRELDAAMKEAADIDAAAPKPARYRLFVSRSMGQEAIEQALAYGEKHQDMVILFRGLKPGEKLFDLTSYLQGLQPLVEGEPMAAVQLDPPAFTDTNVTVVPTLQRLDEEGRVLATIRGIANPSYLEDLVAKGERGDLGARGTTSPIVEQDLVEVLKQRMQAYDWKGGAQRAADNFWRRQETQDLPKATRDRRRLFDPSVTWPEDVVTAAGTVIMRAGQTFNPLEDMPLDDTIFVFDGTDEAQVKWLEQKLSTVTTKNYWLVTTRLDTEIDNGWGSFTGLMQRLNERVYFLLPGQRERIGVERVPSIVTQAGNRLQIDEFAVTNN